MINIDKNISKTYQTLSELRQLNVKNWSETDKQEMEKEVNEVIKMALATKLKLQRASLNAFLDTLEQQDGIETTTLESTIKYMEIMLSKIQSLEPALKKAS